MSHEMEGIAYTAEKRLSQPSTAAAPQQWLDENVGQKVWGRFLSFSC